MPLVAQTPLTAGGGFEPDGNRQRLWACPCQAGTWGTTTLLSHAPPTSLAPPFLPSDASGGTRERQLQEPKKLGNIARPIKSESEKPIRQA